MCLECEVLERYLVQPLWSELPARYPGLLPTEVAVEGLSTQVGGKACFGCGKGQRALTLEPQPGSALCDPVQVIYPLHRSEACHQHCWALIRREFSKTVAMPATCTSFSLSTPITFRCLHCPALQLWGKKTVQLLSWLHLWVVSSICKAQATQLNEKIFHWLVTSVGWS